MLDHSHICFPEGIRKTLSNNDDQNNKLRDQFKKAIDSLSKRRFSQGLYVKKLHGMKSTFQGVKKNILEARLDQKERLLFDYSPRYCKNCKKIISHIRILDYVFDHDDVNKRARRLNLGIDDETWKTWDDVQSEKITATDGMPGYKDYFAGELDLTKEYLEGSGQWYLAEQADLELFVQKPDKAFELLLTKEQSNCQRKIGPVLINGSAGSGKTILGVYQLAQAVKANPECKALYVTYFKHLQEEVRDLFSAIVPDHKIAEKIGQPGVCFLTFQELCDSLIPDKERKAVISIKEFSSWIAKYPGYQNIDINYVWTEIMCVIKGLITEDAFKKDLFKTSEMLSSNEYLDLGDKEAVYISRSERDRAYEITLKYQEYLDAKKLSDEPGLAREAIRHVVEPMVDMIVADEIQDLSQIQIELLFHLLPYATKGQGLFLTGDLQQVITSNSFRWENIRNLFYYRSAEMPQLNRLRFNFRSRAPIVKMANKILEIRQKKVGRYSDETEPEHPIIAYGDLIPGICNLDEDEFCAVLHEMGTFGIDIIVRSKLEKDRLQRVLKSESIWTIEETKGLGLNDVILWRLADETLGAKFSEFILQPDKSSPFSELAHEFNRIYVAITRVCRNIIVYEESSSSQLWDRLIENSILNQVLVGDIDRYLHVLRTPQDAYDRGMYFFKKEQYSVALEAFEKAQDSTMIRKTKAYLCNTPEEYAEMAELFEQAGEDLEAKKFWGKAEQPLRLAKCLCVLNEFKDAAVIYEEHGKYLLAAEQWGRAGNYVKAANCYDRGEKYLEAAENWELAEKYFEAAVCWEKIEEFARAAKCYEKIKDYHSAAVAWEKAESFQHAAENWEKIRQWLQAGRCWELIGEYEKAARCWEHAKEYQKAGLAWEAAKCYLNAARIYEFELQLLDRAAKNWALAKKYDSAAGCWNKFGRWAKAAVCWELNGEIKQAGEIWEANHKYKRAAELWEKCGDFSRARICWDKNGEPAKIIEFQIRLNKFEDVAQSYADKEDFTNAAVYFEKAGLLDKAANCSENGKDFGMAARIWDLAERYSDAGRCWEIALKFDSAAASWIKCHEYPQAAKCYEQSGEKIKAAECWEQSATETKEKNSWISAMNLYAEVGNTGKSLFCKVQLLILDGKYKDAGQRAEKKLRNFELAEVCYKKARDYGALKRLRERTD